MAFHWPDLLFPSFLFALLILYPLYSNILERINGPHMAAARNERPEGRPGATTQPIARPWYMRRY